MSAIFGDDGLISVDDTFNFEAKSLQVKEIENYKQFIKYYDHHLKPRTSSFVTEANRRINTKKLWTNNNAESMNRVMKVAVNWKPQSTPELIQKLYNMVDSQFINLRSALYSTGEYELTSSYTIYVFADMVWRTKKQEEKDKLFKNFFKNSKKRTINNVVTSSNGLYKVPNKAQKITMKHGQVKRSRSEKTK